MDKIQQIADQLISQHRNRKQFSNLLGNLRPVSKEEAYLAQFEFQAKSSRGPLGGFKIALASTTQQELCGINSPIAGGIFSKEIFPTNHPICLDQYYGLGLEFELAFRISKQILPNDLRANKFNMLSCVDNIYPAFELIVDRDADYQNLDALTLIADNAWSAGVILGDPIPNWENISFADLNSSLHWNSEPIMCAPVINANPLTSLAWVANHLGNMGKTIPKNSIIITGSVLQTRKPIKGDKVVYRMEDIAQVEASII